MIPLFVASGTGAGRFVSVPLWQHASTDGISDLAARLESLFRLQCASGFQQSGQCKACMAIPTDENLQQLRSYLLRYARLRLRDPALAEDVVQEALLAALDHGATFAGKSEYKS